MDIAVEIAAVFAPAIIGEIYTTSFMDHRGTSSAALHIKLPLKPAFYKKKKEVG